MFYVGDNVMVKLIVTDDCIGCSACVSHSPGLFEMSGAKAVPTKPELEENELDNAKQTVDICPVDAIKIE